MWRSMPEVVFLATAPLGDIVLHQPLERVDALAALGLERGHSECRHGCRKPTCGALGSRVDQSGDGVVAQAGGLRPRPLQLLLVDAHELAQLLVDGVEAGQLSPGGFEVPGQPLDVLLDQLQPSAAEAHRHILEQAVETILQSTEAPIEGGQGLGRVVVSERLLQLGGNIGETALQPGPVVGWRRRVRLGRRSLHRPRLPAGRGPRPPAGRAVGLRRLVDAGQCLGRSRVPGLVPRIVGAWRCLGRCRVARLFARLPLLAEGGDALCKAGNLMLEAAERARVLLRQGGGDLLHLAAELAESRLHVRQHVAVAPIGVPDLTGNALQRILQAGGG